MAMAFAMAKGSSVTRGLCVVSLWCDGRAMVLESGLIAGLSSLLQYLLGR